MNAAVDTFTARAARDLTEGVRNWRIWWLLGSNDIRQRYRRSRVGQFWLTLSMAVFVTAIGIVYSTLFRQPIQEYIPFLAANIVVWTLISGMISDATTAFTQAEGFLRQEAMPKTIFIWRILVRNFIAFAHNLLIIPFVFLIFGVAPSWTWLMAIPGIALIAVAGFLAALICAVLSTRFRDLPQIVQNLLQIVFFISPITWRVDSLPQDAWYIVNLNPFAAYLRIVSEPILGRIPGGLTYLSTLVVLLLLALVALPLFTRFRARIVYWL